MLKRTIWIFWFLLSACASLNDHGGEHIKNVNQSLIDIQKAVDANLPQGKRTVSTNGRESFSNYFIISDGRIKPGDRGPERYFAHVYVLGDERPYSIEIVVIRERRLAQGGDLSPRYQEVAKDSRIAKIIARQIQDVLSKRREDRNIIDDFRVF